MKKLTRFIALLAFIALPFAVQAEPYTVENLPSPKVYGQDFYVSNPDTVIYLITDTFLNHRLKELQQNTDVEMAVVVIDEYDENLYATGRDFALKLFNYWGIGDKDKNTGLLLFLARRTREVEIITGSGIEGIMTDAACGEILDDAILYLKNDEFDSGIIKIVHSIDTKLMEPDNRMELLSGKRPADPEEAEALGSYLIIGFLLMIIFALLGYKKLNGKPGQSKKEIQAQSKDTQTCLGCLMFIFPIPLVFFYLYYRYARKHVEIVPPNCNICGHAMDQVELDDGQLTKNQLVEKGIGSYEFSLWKCPNCGESELIKNEGNKYKEYDVCPKCNARAYKNIGRVVLESATYRNSGKRLDTYCCQACGNQIQKTVILPRKEYSSSSSSSGGGYSRSSSSSGGSWGGGHSSGGGAGRRF
ncbi:MAG: TPM domain-containing protein [Paludibacteraceae bacterium]|nr:TPM domain-containing protein [Paludibacteraceae bacterium]